MASGLDFSEWLGYLIPGLVTVFNWREIAISECGVSSREFGRGGYYAQCLYFPEMPVLKKKKGLNARIILSPAPTLTLYLIHPLKSSTISPG